GLHESVGFTPVGVYRTAGFKLGVWYDVGWWQRPLQAAPPAPRSPRGLGDVLAEVGHSPPRFG
ncbi:MAG: GNAT family N-acetyltransferase, partial [Gemmatimonadaceae bacterium]